MEKKKETNELAEWNRQETCHRINMPAYERNHSAGVFIWFVWFGSVSFACECVVGCTWLWCQFWENDFNNSKIVYVCMQSLCWRTYPHSFFIVVVKPQIKEIAVIPLAMHLWFVRLCHLFHGFQQNVCFLHSLLLI